MIIIIVFLLKLCLKFENIIVEMKTALSFCILLSFLTACEMEDDIFPETDTPAPLPVDSIAGPDTSESAPGVQITEDDLSSVPFDFRDRITGIYTGDKRVYSYVMGGPPIISDTTYAYSFSISADPANPKAVLFNGQSYPLDKRWTYSVFSVPGPSSVKLYFINDSAYFRSGWGSLGGNGFTYIRGRKQ